MYDPRCQMRVTNGGGALFLLMFGRHVFSASSMNGMRG